MHRFMGLGVVLLCIASTVTAQHHHAGEVTAEPRVGSVNLSNDGNAAAQPHFLRGLALLHNFEYPSAREAFQEAQIADAGFALAYWGEAMTFNYPLWAQQDAEKARAALAKLGPTREARAAKARSPREKQWLSAVESLYGPGTKIERDRAYAESMRVLFEADPKDINGRTFRALSLMGLAHSGRDIPLYMQAAALLEEGLPANPDHPGLLHYMIHAYDDPAHAPLGERAARRYAVVVPDAGHAQHMVSHIYLALGRWPEVEAANVQAMKVVNGQRAAKGRPVAYCGHYSEWQAYAVMQQGRDASELVALCLAEAMRELREKPDSTALGIEPGSVASWSDMAVRHGIETGTWPDTVALPAGRYEFAKFNLAYAKLLSSRSNAAEAANAVAAMKRSRAAIVAAMRKEMPDDTQMMPWVERAVAQGDALVKLAGGKRSAGMAALEKAAAAEAALPVPFGPPLLQKPSAELLGEELLAVGRKAEAAEAFRSALAAAPKRRLATVGLTAATR